MCLMVETCMHIGLVLGLASADDQIDKSYLRNTTITITADSPTFLFKVLRT
jgi:hypothetical protein